MSAIIIDDARPLFTPDDSDSPFECTHSINAENAFKGTISSCRPVRTQSSALFLDFDFDGSAVTLVGRPTRGLALEFTLDGSTVQPAVLEYNDSDIGKDGVVIWKLNGLGHLEDSLHNVKIYLVSGRIDLDYLSYTRYPGPYGFPAVSDDVLVDDQDPNEPLRYNGPWNKSASASLPSGRPLNGTYSVARAEGASFSVNYTGSNVRVFGLLNSVEGRLTASYSVDGRQPVNVTHFDGSQTVNASQWALSQTLYDEHLPVGVHQLTVTVVEVTGNQSFYFDYLIYDGLSLPPNPVIPSTPLKPISGLRGGALGGVIAGSIIGAIVFLALVFLCVGRQRRSAKATLPPARSQGKGGDFTLQLLPGPSLGLKSDVYNS